MRLSARVTWWNGRVGFGIALTVTSLLLIAFALEGTMRTKTVPVVVATGMWLLPDPAKGAQTSLRFTLSDGTPAQLRIENSSPFPGPQYVLLSHVDACRTADNAELKPVDVPSPANVVEATVSPSAAMEASSLWPLTVSAQDVGTISVFKPASYPVSCSLERGIPAALDFEERGIRFFHKIDYFGTWFQELLRRDAQSERNITRYHTSDIDDYRLSQPGVEAVRIDYRFGDLETKKASFNFNQIASGTWSPQAFDAAYGADVEWTEARLLKEQEFILLLAAALLGWGLPMLYEGLFAKRPTAPDAGTAER